MSLNCALVIVPGYSCWQLKPRLESATMILLRQDKAEVIRVGIFTAVVLNFFHCWDPLKATEIVWDPQVKIEKVCAPENVANNE